MKKIKVIFIGTLIAAAIAGIGFHIYSRIEASRPLPKFSYNSEKAPGWWGSENINAQDVARTVDYTGEEPIDRLPVADLTVHHGLPGEDTPADNCFVMHSYYNYPLGDQAAAYEKYTNRKTELGTIKELHSEEQSIETFEGEKVYTLQQYSFTIEGQDALTGYEVGFVPLGSDGYIRIEGVCKTYEDLALTLPILQSVQLLER